MTSQPRHIPASRKPKLEFDEALNRLNAYIEEHHMRHTPEREMVLEEICKLPQPFTAERLYAVCKPLRLSQGTIYNSLSLFILARILHANSREHGRISTAYELTVGPKSRMQFVCIRCGRTVEFNDKAVAHIVRARKYTNFVPEYCTMVVYGQCKVCRRKQLIEN